MEKVKEKGFEKKLPAYNLRKQRVILQVWLLFNARRFGVEASQPYLRITGEKSNFKQFFIILITHRWTQMRLKSTKMCEVMSEYGLQMIGLKGQMGWCEEAIVGVCEGWFYEIRRESILEGKDTLEKEKMDCRACENGFTCKHAWEKSRGETFLCSLHSLRKNFSASYAIS